jgi:hypothetical protein
MRLNKADRLDEMLRNGTTAEPPLAKLVAAARQVEALRPVPPLPAVAVSSARQTFLAQAVRMRSMNAHSSAARQPAGWLPWLRPNPLRRTFAPTLAAILLVVLLTVTTGLAFNSLGMAAKTSLPGDRLYGYKIAQEDMGLALTFDLPDRVALYVELVKQRSEELFHLVQEGRPLPAETAARMLQHLQDALRTASQLPDSQMGSALVQIRQVSLGAQVTLKQAQGLAHDDQSRLTLAAAASAVSNASAMAEQGLVDPREFRTQMSALLLMPTGTPVVVMPTATSILFNPPETSPSPYPSPYPSIVPFPSPSTTSLPAEATSIPATPTSTTAVNTPENPPTVPATPSPTSVSAGSTPVPPTVTSTPTPTATQTPEPPPSFPTPTPISH